MSYDKIIKSILPVKIVEAKPFISRIRELEEVQKGEFIAFVDEGEESYDVKIKFSPDLSKINISQCDCPSHDTFCKHTVALLLHLKSGAHSSNDSIAIKKIKKKKLSPLEILIDELDSNRLKHWLLEELKKNKELLLKFNSQFEENNTEITPEQISEYGNAVLKSILKNKKNIEASQLTSILHLWSTYFDKKFDSIIHAITTKNDVKIIVSFIDFLHSLDYKLKTRSDKHIVLRNSIVTKIVYQLGIVHDFNFHQFLEQVLVFEISNKRSLHFFFDLLFSTKNKLNADEYLKIIIKLFNSIDVYHYLGEGAFIRLISDVKSSGIFPKVSHLFHVIYYANAYNQYLIRSLIEIQKYDMATNACNDIIKSNIKPSYNIPYLQFLIEIYQVTDNKPRKFDTLNQLFLINPSYSLYCEIYNLIVDDNAKEKFKAHTLNARPKSWENDYHNFLEVKMGIWIEDENYDAIFNSISTKEDLDCAVAYLDQLFNFNKKRLFHIFLKCLAYYFSYHSNTKNIQVFVEFIRSHYNKSEILEWKDALDIYLKNNLNTYLKIIFP